MITKCHKLVLGVIAMGLVLPFARAEGKWLEKGRPDFPFAVYYQGMSGSVTLSLVLGQDGRVRNADVLRSSGHATLDRLAREVVMNWRLSPESVLATDTTQGRVEVVSFRNPNLGKKLVPGSTPYWALVR
jgi:TonB family protein